MRYLLRFRAAFVAALVAALTLAAPQLASAQTAAPATPTYTAAIDVTSWAELVRSNGVLALSAAFGVALSFFIARKLLRWVFGAV